MTNENGTAPSGLALVEAAEAAAAEAAARAEAATARAKAVRLRHELAEQVDIDGTDDSEPRDVHGVDVPGDRSRIRFRRPRARPVAVAAAIVGLVAILTANGFLAWHHYRADHDRQRAVQFATAARQGVVNMTTLDFNRADADVARVLDSATGDFRADFASRVDEFTKVVKDSKVVTVGTVTAAAVQSMTKDSAVVLVAANSTLTDAKGTKGEPRKWRLNVTVTRDADQLKMSKVEFAP
jgi:Mce-associated membrane protein